jgi:hypothetical protein
MADSCRKSTLCPEFRGTHKYLWQGHDELFTVQ